jgi:phage terminase large subunit
MVPFGVDDPGKHHSTEWDIVFVDEATDLTEDQWERFHRSLRWNQLPWQQLIGACNPGAAWHWLNQRCNRGLCRRIVTVHGDNPTNTPEYLAALDRKQTGVRRDRLFLGKWTNAEGLILNTYRADKHLISIVKRGDDYARIEYDKDGDPVEKNLGIKGYFGSIDWGTRAPGVFQVWGQDAEKRLYMLVEVYRQGRDPVWWTDVIADLVERHRIYAVVADPEDAGRRDMLNDRLQQKGMGRIVRPADNRWEAGIELLRSAFARDMLFINRDALLDGPDPELKAVAAPCSTPDELESYVFYKGAPGWTEIQRVKYERPDPACADHGCDTTRYAGMFGWQNQVLSESTEDVMARRSLADVTYPPGSLGDVLGHREFWAEQRRKELAGERDIDEESLDRFARSLLR